MKVVIAGGAGFIGGALIQSLQFASDTPNAWQGGEDGVEVVLLARRPHGVARARTVVWDARSEGPWARELEGADLLINLAGAPINGRWTPVGKKAILDSRIESTRALAKAALTYPPKVWLNASASGYYGNRGDEEVTEDSGPGKGFLAEVCVAWESALFESHLPATRRTALRIGVVLGRDVITGQLGGALKTLAPLTRYGLGGQIGNGRQYLPWVHLDDLVDLFALAAGPMNAGHSGSSRVVNACAPEAQTNAQFMRALRHSLKVPFGIPAPAFGMQLAEQLAGFPAETVLFGAKVKPVVALESGFTYKHATLVDALQSVMG